MVLNNLLPVLFLSVSCLISIEIGARNRLDQLINRMLVLIKQVRVILSSSKISDHWKEKVIPTYACALFKKASALLLILLGMLSPFFVSQLILNKFIVFCMSIQGLIMSIVISYVYVKKIR
jgi:hypothetical protein